MLSSLGYLQVNASEQGGVYEKKILPILEEHCFDCHGDGTAKGKVSFDKFSTTEELLNQEELWLHVLKNVRSGLMPPPKKERVPAAELTVLEDWIKQVPLKLDPENPNPGRVTLHRLNRVEYRNTIRDLMGYDFRAEEEFPADDTGYGFDTIADALSTSPLLLEKYMQAAESIVAGAVPLVTKLTPEKFISADRFTGTGERDDNLSLYDPADLKATINIKIPGTYRIELHSTLHGSFAYDPGMAEFVWAVAGKEISKQQLKWRDSLDIKPTHEIYWQAGEYPVQLTLKPLVGKDKKPEEKPGDGPPNIDLTLYGVKIIGPLEPEHATPPENYSRFFSQPEFPTDAAEKKSYAQEILRRFTTRAYRRPVDDATINKLTDLALAFAATEGSSFPKGIGKAMSAVIASPRFLFRMEDLIAESDPHKFPLIDEYALASRLSYFLWSTMPDKELFSLAEKGELRKNLPAQINRMVHDSRSKEFVKNFAGQWLQTRDVQSVSIDARIVQARDIGQEKEMKERFERYLFLKKAIGEAEKNNDEKNRLAYQAEVDEMRKAFRKNNRRIEFAESLRRAMRAEAEMLFSHLLQQDLSVLELVDNNYTFLNQELAEHYGIPDVHGGDMRMVTLPADSPRGGIITMGSVLSVTSNPTRTSPVKRGLFILDNILGTPPPPPPPNIPSLEASEKTHDGRNLTLRDALALHREKPLCASCHQRMDPLGLALENFNALGSWRTQDQGIPLLSPAGQLITGEKFADVRELKHLLVTARRTDYYRCITEKLFTYALGRGPQPCDVTTIDSIVAKLEKSNGKFSQLIYGIIESAAFQKTQVTKP